MSATGRAIPGEGVSAAVREHVELLLAGLSAEELRAIATALMIMALARARRTLGNEYAIGMATWFNAEISRLSAALIHDRELER